jgi:exodeoxyribonuclease VII small subunit
MPDAPPRLEQALAELDRILRELEDGTTTLDDALARYERGVGLVKVCHAQLRDAEQRISQLAGVADDGTPDLKPFAHTAAVEKAKPRKPPPSNNGEIPY